MRWCCGWWRTRMVAAVRGGQAKRPAAPARAPKRAKTAHAVVSPRLIFAGVGGALVLGVGVFLNTGERPAAISHAASDFFGRQTAKAGFKVKALHLQGASPAAHD